MVSTHNNLVFSPKYTCVSVAQQQAQVHVVGLNMLQTYVCVRLTEFPSLIGPFSNRKNIRLSLAYWVSHFIQWNDLKFG